MSRVARTASLAACAVVATMFVMERRRRKLRKPVVFVVGASGAIGLPFVRYLLDHGHRVICGLHKRGLPEDVSSHPQCVQEFNVDVLGRGSLDRVFERNTDIEIVCNFAAPLSVESERNPTRARDITVGGMRRLLRAMRAHGVKRIVFSDSIGSFGSTSPREDAKASWLIHHPNQDPGSAYGKQKRKCRELMAKFVREDPKFRDARWLVIPGVLHCAAKWGEGTTEYALEAVRCAARGETFQLRIPIDAKLPMIFVSDLLRALHVLMLAPRSRLCEPNGGYTACGFSFTPEELFVCLKHEFPSFEYEIGDLDPAASRCALTWPDSISPVEMKRDLGFESDVSFLNAIGLISKAARARASLP